MDIPLTPTFTFTNGGSYSVPITIAGQSLPLQVDLGSSDMIVASTQCQSTSCSGSVPLLDTEGIPDTGQSFSSAFLSGSFQGPILNASIGIGIYSIDYQALAAAKIVDGEPLSGSRFSGILGLGLPSKSLISAANSNSESFDTFVSNLFVSSSYIPSQQDKFFTLTLARQNDPRYLSLLTIAKHNLQLPPTVPVKSVPLASVFSPTGQPAAYWRTPLQSITVNGVSVPFTSSSKAAFKSSSPIALLDTGIAAILTSRDFANSFWGAAANIGPADDGNYYVPCNTSFNASLSFTAFPSTVFPLHPLDLTQSGMQSGSCIGQLQAYDLGENPPADFILGTSAIRNFYSVFSLANFNVSKSAQFGLLPLTNQDTAHQEFIQVRIDGKSLDTSDNNQSSSTFTHTTSNGAQQSGQPPPPEADHSIPVGAAIGIAIGCFAVLIFILVASYMCYRSKKNRRQSEILLDAYGNHPHSPLDNPTLNEQERMQDKQEMADLVAKDDAEQSRWRMFHEPGPEAVARP